MIKHKKLTTSLFTLAVVGMMSIPVFASVSNKTISLASDQAWSSSYSDSRTGKYSDVYARCHTVYPDSGSDNFEKIQVRVLNSSGTVISANSYETLKETASSNSSISLKQGYLTAKAVVSYDGR